MFIPPVPLMLIHNRVPIALELICQYINELFILPCTGHLLVESVCPAGLLQLPAWGLIDAYQTPWDDDEGRGHGDSAMLLTFPFPEHSASELPWGTQEA